MHDFLVEFVASIFRANLVWHENGVRFGVRTLLNAELNALNLNGSRFGIFPNQTSGSGSAFREKGPEPEPNRTVPPLPLRGFEPPSPHFSGVNLTYTTRRQCYTGPRKLEIWLTGGAKAMRFERITNSRVVCAYGLIGPGAAIIMILSSTANFESWI
jgi:hypothetical protein